MLIKSIFAFAILLTTSVKAESLDMKTSHGRSAMAQERINYKISVSNAADTSLHESRARANIEMSSTFTELSHSKKLRPFARHGRTAMAKARILVPPYQR